MFENHNNSFLDRGYLDDLYELVDKATPKFVKCPNTWKDYCDIFSKY